MAKVDIKVVVLGQEGVGKSCLVDRFISQRFDEYQKNTIGAAFAAKKVSSSLGYVSLGIWDTAGVERFLNLTRVYCRSAHAAVICFHPLDRESWGRARLWAQDLVDAEPSCALYLVATRADQWLEDAALFKFRSTIAESDSSSVISGRNPGHYRMNSEGGFLRLAPSGLSKYRSAAAARKPAVGKANSLQAIESDSQSSLPEGPSSSTECAPRLVQDLQVPLSEIEEFAESVKAKLMMASAKTGYNCMGVFHTIAEDLAEEAAKRRSNNGSANLPSATEGSVPNTARTHESAGASSSAGEAPRPSPSPHSAAALPLSSAATPHPSTSAGTSLHSAPDAPPRALLSARERSRGASRPPPRDMSVPRLSVLEREGSLAMSWGEREEPGWCPCVGWVRAALGAVCAMCCCLEDYGGVDSEAEHPSLRQGLLRD